MISDILIVDGVKYDAFPSSVSWGGMVVLSPVEALSGDMVVSSPVARDSGIPQTWNKLILGYTATDFMPTSMRDHWDMLYQTSKPFWLQMDDFFAYEDIVCTRLSPTEYLAPLRPIFPYDYEPNGTQTFAGKVRVNGVTRNDCVVDQRTGKLTFPSALSDVAAVRIDALRRLYCRITTAPLLEPAIQKAQSYYAGSIELTEVVPTDAAIASCRYLPDYEGGRWGL